MKRRPIKPPEQADRLHLTPEEREKLKAKMGNALKQVRLKPIIPRKPDGEH